MPAPPIDQDYILEGQQALAGLIGSLIMVLKDPKKRTRAERFSAVLAGVASSVYLTEPVMSFFYKDVIPAKYLLGFSFLFGVCGLRFVELLAEYGEKVMKKKLEEKFNK